MSPPINGVATSITAFIGSALRGPTELPGSVNSFAEFEQLYGGLWAPSSLGYAVQQFFLNGGGQALIVRVEGDGAGGITDADIIASLPALDQADLFNLLCIPPLKRHGGDVGKPTWDAAIAYASSRRAFVIVDPAERWASADDVLNAATGLTSVVTPDDNAAIYFPRILASDPLHDGQTDSFAPGGTIAGVFAETDLNRGVWTAPAGLEAAMQGVLGLSLGGSASPGKLSDADSGRLNLAAINSFRNVPTSGTVLWGARTLKGTDAQASDWKYIPVRRPAFYIEESVVRGIKWAAFEPNDQALWAQIQLSVNAFMHTLFTQGAFQGTTPPQAYFVKCDSTTTTPADMENGIVNVVIGFAPIRPAEFVMLTIQQTALVS
ncbi:MAG TPA: phage tail sheath C-terminal domain-containing protein [Bradyrhizobium sp.]|nr:phage tail sheath C-terminal domain-containing protein [Bradyrhizobium sp.]